MKKLELTVFERENLRAWLGSPQTRVIGLTAIHAGLSAMAKLELTDEEKASIGWKDIGDNRATWERADDTFKLEFTNAELRVLKPVLQAPWPISIFYEQLLEKMTEVYG